MFRWLMVAAALAVTTPAGAQSAETAVDHWYGGEYKRCDGSTIAIVQCVSALRDKWDGRLNKAYQQIMGSESEARKTALRDAQRKWIAYRDANCSFYAAGEGTITQIETAVCHYVLTRDRALELEMTGQP